MAKPYLPSRESELVTWVNSFQSTIVSAAADFGLTDTQASDYRTAHTAFVSAYQIANESATRSPGNIVKKNTAKDALVDLTRELVDVCQSWPAMTNDKREELQITLRGNGPTPVPPPETSPNIDLLSMVGWTLSFRLHNGDSTKRAKPDGVKGASMFTYVGETPPSNVDDWNFMGSITTTTSTLDFPTTLAVGTKVWITSFWFNPTLQSGPAATPVSTQINYGGLSQAA